MGCCGENSTIPPQPEPPQNPPGTIPPGELPPGEPIPPEEPGFPPVILVTRTIRSYTRISGDLLVIHPGPLPPPPDPPDPPGTVELGGSIPFYSKLVGFLNETIPIPPPDPPLPPEDPNETPPFPGEFDREFCDLDLQGDLVVPDGQNYLFKCSVTIRGNIRTIGGTVSFRPTP
jgi:hypothetical protein